jgi:uncharacterized protein YcgI (DUF1989 family)
VIGPADAARRRGAPAVIVYPDDTLPPADVAGYRRAREGAVPVASVEVPPRDARAIRVPAGHVLRLVCPDGPQVGDLNLFAAEDLSELFFSGKTRALHGTHVSVGDRLWSCLPFLRPMATIIHDDLGWYGIDADGASVHDVIGTRCDPYTQRLLQGTDYDRCCHSNLTRALAAETGLPPGEAERHVHDVLNLFMCTGFTRDTGQYFMKASPVRPGDAMEMWAEIDLLAVLSACPGGDCGSEHSSDRVPCFPLRMEVLAPAGRPPGWAPAERSAYAGRHGL